MGFSVSGTFAILVLASFIAFGAFYGAVSNGYDRVTDAQQATFDNHRLAQNTAINVTRADWNGTNDTLKIEVLNAGSVTLDIEATDILVDNTYIDREQFETEWVGTSTNTDTDLWQPGEVYHVEINRTVLETETGSVPPNRTKIVTETGVSASVAVESTG